MKDEFMEHLYISHDSIDTSHLYFPHHFHVNYDFRPFDKSTFSILGGNSVKK